MVIDSVEKALKAFPRQQDIGAMYRPPISQQAVNGWKAKGWVPSARVPKLIRELQKRGHRVVASKLNPNF